MKKKLTTQELDSVKKLQQDFTQVALSLGNIKLQTEELIEKEKEIIGFFKKLKEEEKVLLEDLNTKYGTGSIDIQTGEITPVNIDTDETIPVVESRSL